MNNNVVGIVRSIEADPSFIGERPPINIDTIANDDTFWESVHELRPELYAISALATDYVVTGAYQNWEQHHELGSSSQFVPELGLQNLRTRLNSTFRSTIAGAFEALETDYPGLLDRFRELTAHFLLTYDGSRYETIEKLIETGIGTATKETLKTLEAVVRTCRLDTPDISIEEIITIAKRSSGLILKAASLNIAHLPAMSGLLEVTNRELIDEEHTPIDVLKLDTNRQGLKYVNFIGPVLNLPCPYDTSGEKTVKDAQLTFETQGCPAIVKFGDTPTVVKLWNWVIDIAEQENQFDQIR
jgi:hypothetical protein